MDVKEKIQAAQARIFELKALIKHWEKQAKQKQKP